MGKEFCKHPALFDEYPRLDRTFEAIRGTEEVLAFNWAVQNILPLRHPRPTPWITTTYEELLENRIEEAARIFRGLGEPVPSRAESMLNRSSATTDDAEEPHRARDQLTKWRDRLTETQVDQILRVVHDVGITMYDETARPDPSHPALSEKEQEMIGDA